MFWKTDTLPCEGNPCKCIDNRLVDREVKLNKLFGIDFIKSPYFKNNHNLRSPDILFEYTEEEIIEYSKAKKDILYFHYLSQKSKKNKLTLYKFQEDLLKSSQKNKFNLVTNSHQSGMGYMLAIKALYSAFSKCDFNTLILTNSVEGGKRILELLKDIYQTLPFFMKPGIRVWNKSNITFDNGSRIICTTPNDISFGIGYQNVIVDNYAYMNMKEKMKIFQNLVPTLLAMKHSELFISSVPNGEEHFKDLVEDEDELFIKHKIHWSEVPGRDNDWKLDRIKMIGSVEAFAQEYENLFTGTKEYNRYINLNKLLN
jgi:hypothetical protein